MTKRVTPLRKIVRVLFAFASLRRFGRIGAGVLPVGNVGLANGVNVLRHIRKPSNANRIVDRFQIFNLIRFDSLNDQLDSISLALDFSGVIFERFNRLILEVLGGHFFDSVRVLDTNCYKFFESMQRR